MIGDHATHHLELDAPLTSDIDGLTSAVCAWTGVSTSPDDLPEVGLKAWQASMEYPGNVTAFVAPATTLGIPPVETWISLIFQRLKP